MMSTYSSFFAQVKVPANTKADILLIQADFKKNNRVSAELRERFAIHTIQGQDYVSMLAKVKQNFSINLLGQTGIIVGGRIKNIVSLKVPMSQLSNISALPGLETVQLAGKVKPDLDKAVKDVGADSVHLGINLPQGYTGKNVFIGITDWGFDYSSPMFYDTLLLNTRIFAAWDQYKTSGPAPSGYAYGTEYTTLSEFQMAGADTSNIYSYATHGTHVAGIAGGSGAGTAYRGVAFESQFLFATFLVDEGAVLDAWEWMYQKAQSESKRLVINMSWGLYHIGTLDGNSLLSQAIDAYADLGVIFANSGGNNGNVNFHIKKNFTNDTLTSRIEFYSYAANQYMWGQSIHMWGEQTKSFDAGIQVYTTSGVLLVESPYYSTATVSQYIDTFLVTGQDTIWFNIAADAIHPLNSRPQMRLRVKNTNTSLRVLLKSRAFDGQVHFWNVTELSTDVGNWGMPFSFFNVGSTPGDSEYGISEPSCTNKLISVAAYSPKWYTGGGSPVGGGIASFSSKGPRYDEVLKPEIAAPGVSIGSSISSYTDNSFTQIASVNFNSRTYPFAKFSGTSMASPMVAGIAALVLEANPYLSAAQVKYILLETAREDVNTGVIPANGSTQWGWGKVDAYRAVKLALETVGLESIEPVLSWHVYPNPVQNQLHFTIIDELPKAAQVIDFSGRVLEKNVQENHIYVGDLNPGSYIVRLVINGRVQQQNFVKL